MSGWFKASLKCFQGIFVVVEGGDIAYRLEIYLTAYSPFTPVQGLG